MWFVTISIASGSPKRFPINCTGPTCLRMTPSQQLCRRRITTLPWIVLSSTTL